LRSFANFVFNRYLRAAAFRFSAAHENFSKIFGKSIDKTAESNIIQLERMLIVGMLIVRMQFTAYKHLFHGKEVVFIPHINKKRSDTRLQIIQVAARLFIDEGYTNTSFSRIARELDLSTGNITFYFKSKEHLLSVLVNELFNFQYNLLERAANEGKTSLLAYCFELTTAAAACREDESIRDFFVSAYSSKMTLELIRENDTQKTKTIFGKYHPEWTDEQWIAIENIVSGIEYATLVTSEEKTPLPLQIETALNSIMMLYGVPEETRKIKIGKILATDYRDLGKRVLKEFKEYINKVNAKKLKQAIRKSKK